VSPVVVFDTNILVSAVGWKGKPYRCLELARSGKIDGVTCPELLEELETTLRTKLCLSAETVLEIIADLLTVLRLVSIAGKLKVIAADPDDDKVLECAAAAGAAFIVTGDRRHLLPLGTFQGAVIVSPADFLLAVSGSE